MEKRKKKKSNSKNLVDFDYKEVQRKIQERKEWFDALNEVEELEKEYNALISEEIINTEDIPKDTPENKFSSSLIVDIDYIGREVFVTKLRYQCFSKENIHLQYRNLMLNYEQLKNAFITRMLIDDILTKKGVRQLYFLMSIEPDEYIVNYCYQKLIQNLEIWTPKLRHIFKVLLNWGATYESLGLVDYEKTFISTKEIMCNVKFVENVTKFQLVNFKKIFEYIREIIFHKNKYLEKEKILLLRCLLTLVLDKQFMSPSLLPIIQDCISILVNSLEKWDTYKIVLLSNVLHNANDHFHNQVVIITDFLPRDNKCKNIISCLSFTVLQILFHREPKYTFPIEITEVENLLREFDLDVNNKDELYRLYVAIHLLNFIVFQERIPELNYNILQNMRTLINHLSWKLTESKLEFDSALIKGRIDYCSSMWSEDVQKSTNNNV